MAMNSDGSYPNRDHSLTALSGVSTPVGPVIVACNGHSIVQVEWSESGTEQSAVALAPTDQILYGAVDQLRRYFEGSLTAFDVPIDFGEISEVALTVLTTLADTVEYGSTITYGELAERSGTGIPARAVGGIMGLNPIPIIVPCHRVVASDSLGGYSGGRRGEGLATKRWLLEFEDALPPTLF